ncbi:MAG: signal peptidase I [Sandaracinus sp.]|nr:signal peptidase I [Sandaracinus sp.]
MSTFWRTSFKIALWVGGFLLVVGGIFRIFFVTPITPGHDGMAPTFLAGEKVLLWRDATLEMGDIAVCENPQTPGSMVIGRIVAKAGMDIEVEERSERLVIAGTRVDTDWSGEESFYDSALGREVTVRAGLESLGNTDHEIYVRDGFTLRVHTTVPNGHLFLMGDNRADRSHDSRTYGPVVASGCIGRVFMRWNPEAGRGDAMDHGWLDWLQ